VESLYLLIPLSVVLVLLIGGILVWAVMSGQFEELDDAGQRVLDEDEREDKS
jgi:cbb3-type cytochrome oxidase maturation protein